MRRISPIEAALELIDTLEAKPNRSDVEDWLLQGFKLCRDDRVKSLDEGLGLAVSAGEAAHRFPNKWRRMKRDRLICEIGRRLDLRPAQIVEVISHSMETAVPQVESREAQILLIKLRDLCQDTDLCLKRSRIYEVLRDGGCSRP